MAGELCRLPLEVLIIILQHAPDLPSIYKFICASTRVNAAFEIDSANILDGAIERSIPDFKHLARMVAILGTFSSSSSNPTYDELLHVFKNMPKDVLSRAPASFAFPSRTPGIRYVLVTSYRIETLLHLCFVYLLENIHELMWCMPPKSGGHSLKRSRAGASFQGAAWYPPSWVERVRVERALWKLVIYWNVCAICQDFRDDDYDFRRYSAKIGNINPRVGPSIQGFSSYQYEVEEMRCVLSITQELLGCTTTRSFEILTPFARQDHPKPCIKTGASLTNLKDTVDWKFQEPRHREDKSGYRSLYYGQERHCAFEPNTAFRCNYWSIWRNTAFKGPDLWFPDYLGLCIWDLKRLSYLGLATVYDKRLSIPEIDENKRTPCNAQFDCGGLVPERWRAVFLHELARSLGGRKGRLLEKYNTLINDWNTARLGTGKIVDGLRLYDLMLIRRR